MRVILPVEGLNFLWADRQRHFLAKPFSGGQLLRELRRTIDDDGPGTRP